MRNFRMVELDFLRMESFQIRHPFIQIGQWNLCVNFISKKDWFLNATALLADNRLDKQFIFTYG